MTPDPILDAVTSHRGEILDFIQELVAVPTENPPGAAYATCVEVLGRRLHEIGLDCGKQGDCLLAFCGIGQRTLYFHGHYDVVPAQSRAQFRPQVRDGKLFGRGASDMKSGLAAMIYAVCALRECGVKLAGKIGIVLVPDEESGGLGGSRFLERAGLLGQDGIGMLTPEPTSGVVWNASRGAVSLRVTVKGKAAHVGLHYQGVNAFDRMLAVAQALGELKKEIETRTTRFQVEGEAGRSSILMMGGRVEGGTNFNTVPSECSFTVDRRINPEENLEAERQALLALLERFRREGTELEVEILQEGHPAGVSEDNPVARALAESVEAVTGKAPSFEMCPGLLEIRFYARQDIPAFAYGPGLLEVSHGPEEYVELENVYDCAAIYALTAARLLGAKD